VATLRWPVQGDATAPTNRPLSLGAERARYWLDSHKLGPSTRVPAGGAAEETAPAKPASPVDFWLGLFLLLYSGGYLSVALRLGDYVTTPAKIGAVAWSVFGAALFVAGGLLFTKGLTPRSTRVALTAAAVLYAVRALFGTFSAGNSFALPSFLSKFEVGPGLAADLAVGVTAVWLVVAVATWAPSPARPRSSRWWTSSCAWCRSRTCSEPPSPPARST